MKLYHNAFVTAETTAEKNTLYQYQTMKIYDCYF